MAIELCNLRKVMPRNPWDVKVDRSSPLGNPFKEGSREKQCQDYEIYFKFQVVELTEIREEFTRLIEIHRQYGKLRLFCWCVPLQCHSMTIKKLLEQYI